MRLLFVPMLAATLALPSSLMAAPPERKIVLIAGTKSHGPGDHEYEKGVRLLQYGLEHAPGLTGYRVEVHTDGWPRDERAFEGAATILLFSDGSDRQEQAHPLLRERRLQTLRALMERGVGFVALHYTVFVPSERAGADFLEWAGGYFDYESGPKPRGWYSKIQTAVGKLDLASPAHPVSRGLTSFQLREEFYYQMKLRPPEKGGVIPILKAMLPGEPNPQTVAWAVERKGGGRGFAYTGGHFHANWQDENVRRMVLNALVWTAGGEVPKAGVTAPLPEHERPIRVQIVTGHQHPAHNWRETTKALREILAVNPRVQVSVTEDPESLGKPGGTDFDVLLLNYVNHERAGLSAQARSALLTHVEQGKGLAVVHFANGAFPDWPDYRQLARRVWVDKLSGHDAHGKFVVKRVKNDHPITEGLQEYETIDELYYRQQGTLPIQVLLSARSKVTGQDEPMAWTAEMGKGRIFQTVLGHDAPALRTPGTAELIRRGTAWSARRSIVTHMAEGAPKPPPGDPIIPGKFGNALQTRVRHAEATPRAEYATLPLTIECWAKLDSARSFNLLVAQTVKESNTHWEIYSIAGSGHFSAYLPGYAPDTLDTGVRITDGRWHHLALMLESDRARLAVDGKIVRDERIKARGGSARPGPLWIGAYPPGNLGCDGLVDEVRISRGVRPVGLPQGPFVPDADTISLWHLDSLDSGRAQDSGMGKNPAVVADARASFSSGRGPSSLTELDYRPKDPRLKAVLVDRSIEESFVVIKADTEGRLFVGGREAVFVYEPDGRGGYEPRRELFRFPPDAWVAGLELRGNDLYVLTASALYRFVGARTQRTGLRPERLLWGLPLDLHVSYHALAWGPQGDLYLNHGDPLLGYGDFQRPDHWGYWIVYGPQGSKIPYTGNGGVFRVRPDGTGFQAVAGGLRGPFGLIFDRQWNLYTNDNDHESRPDLYTPGRLLHVTPHVDFAWPRGWMASKLPDRADLVEPMRNLPGRGVPVGMTYYDDSYLPDLRSVLLEARWDALTIEQHSLEPRGGSFRATSTPFLVGRERARPVGVAVGRGGRVFVAVSYMAGNEASPHYISDLVMITRADDTPGHPFQPYDITTLPGDRLWAELSEPSWERRREAHTELLRRGGPLLAEALPRLRTLAASDLAKGHLPWLVAALPGEAPVAALTDCLSGGSSQNLRLTALRALSERAPSRVPSALLADADPAVRLAALGAFFSPETAFPIDAIVAAARTRDTHIRQTATRLLARRAPLAALVALSQNAEAEVRLAGVLALGFRLTVPEPHSTPAPEVRLSYPKGNAFFQAKIRYADKTDQEVELSTLGRIGSTTSAETWRAVTPSPDQQTQFAALVSALKDREESVRLQAAYFLSLLKDSRSEPDVAAVFAASRATRLATAPRRTVERAWRVGPFAEPIKALENGPIDLEAGIPTNKGQQPWQDVTLPGGRVPAMGREGTDYSYLFFRLESGTRQPLLLATGIDASVWHNGHLVSQGATAEPLALDMQPGGNEILVRHRTPLTLSYQARDPVTATLPEKLGAATLAQRLREAGKGTNEALSPEFFGREWTREAAQGDAAVGRKLFGSLGCARCHAITAEQSGGGAPSLTDAARRFPVAYLVESILLPSRQIAESFRGTSLSTKQGTVIAGLIVAETAEVVEILLPDGTRRSVRKMDIEERTSMKTSPMPAGVVKTPAELRDLLAYLMSERPLPP